MIIGFYRFRLGKQSLKTNKPKRNSKDGFTPRPCKVKPFGFLKKIFLSSLRSKRVFFPKNLAWRSVYALCFAFLFSFFRFFFFRGASLFAALCSAHRAPHRRRADRTHQATAHSDRDHAHRPTPSRLVPDGGQVPTGNRRTAAAPSSSAVDEVRPSVPHRWGSHRGTKARNKKRFSMFRETRETKSVSRCQSMKKPTATKWPSAHVENLTI